MVEFDPKLHWENIYKTKQLSEVSWFQENPVTSLEFISKLKVQSDAKIIDIGGGDSFLVDHLLEKGFSNITVVDISENAIERAKLRLGHKSKNVNWIVTDITKFHSNEKFDFWHDRAAFHFLITEKEIKSYLEIIKSSLNPGGFLVIGTFSENGPKKCSGLEIRQYSETNLVTLLNQIFDKVECITVDHTTPFDTTQNFVFCSFKKI